MTFEITSQIRNFSWTIRAENKKNQNIFKKRLEKKQKKYYIMEHEEIRAADTDKWKSSWRNGRRAWFRSKFFHRSGGSTPPDGTKIFCKKLRVWHNGCAPAFQAGYRGSTPLTRSIKFGGIPERPKGADCKSASTAFDGSNPSPTTIYLFNRL